MSPGKRFLGKTVEFLFKGRKGRKDSLYGRRVRFDSSPGNQDINMVYYWARRIRRWESEVM
jgi:hypothetical protein